MLLVQLIGELVCVGAADWRVGLCWWSLLESWFVLVQLFGELVCVGAADWRVGLCWCS